MMLLRHALTSFHHIQHNTICEVYILIEDAILFDQCKKWAERLGLSHWSFKIRYANPGELEEWVDGQVLHRQCQEHALILIKRPDEYKALEGREQDIEEIIVHELLHVVFGLYPDISGRLQEKVFDQSVDRVARTLVRLSRGTA